MKETPKFMKWQHFFRVRVLNHITQGKIVHATLARYNSFFSVFYLKMGKRTATRNRGSNACSQLVSHRSQLIHNIFIKEYYFNNHFVYTVDSVQCICITTDNKLRAVVR